MDETKKEIQELLDGIMSMAEEIDFQTGLLLDGNSIPPDLAKFRSLAWDRYVENFDQIGAAPSDTLPFMGPQILFQF